MMLAIAPLLPAPPGGIAAEFGWSAFSAWDSLHYERIATSGYDFTGSNPAFFPLLPGILGLLARGGLPFDAAGAILCNVAFFGAAIVLHRWVSERYDPKVAPKKIARWATIALVCCPYAVFGSTIYTEAPYLLFLVLSLRAFDRTEYRLAGIFGALATATRLTGLALVATFWWLAWRQRLGIGAFWAGLGAGAGIASYSAYCWWQSGNPLAFISAQAAWNRAQDYPGQLWLKVFAQIFLGPQNWPLPALGAADPWHPLAVGAILGLASWAWRQRGHLGAKVGAYGLGIGLWLLAGDPLLNALMVFGGMAVLWQTRHQLDRTALVYGCFSFAIIFLSGRTTSVGRFAFGIISLAPACGLLLARAPKHGLAIAIVCAIVQGLFAIRFAQHLWVG